MEIKYWAGTDVGRKRSENEDNFLIDKRLKLFVVADGMGGHASGEIASAMAVHGIREVIDRERDIFDAYDDDDPKCHVEVCTLLEYAVHYTCAQIFHKARREPEKRGMGTTLVVLLFIGARGFIAYVGDSRIYLLRGGIVYQLTEDHSLRNELIRMGKITEDEFESSPYANLKNAMTRAVGVYESVEADTLDFDIIPGDAFMLCSDGLYEYLSDDDIGTALALPAIREVPGMLIEKANTRGGKDNITAVVVQVAGDGSEEDRAADLNFALDILKNVPLFRELSYQQLVRVMNLSQQVTVEVGQKLFVEGQQGRELFVVLRGHVELTRDEVVVANVGPGAHLGEMSLVDDSPRSATATVTQPGKVLTVQRKDFYDVLRREPALAVKLLWSFVRVMADRLRTTTAELADARAAGLTELTELVDEVGGDPSPQQQGPITAEMPAISGAIEPAKRRRARSGTVIAPSPNDPTRAEPQHTESAPTPPPAEPRIDPRATLINTTTSNPTAPGDSAAPTAGSADAPTVATPSATPPSPAPEPDPFAAAKTTEFEAIGAPTPVAETPSWPVMTSATAPRVPPPPTRASGPVPAATPPRGSVPTPPRGSVPTPPSGSAPTPPRGSVPTPPRGSGPSPAAPTPTDRVQTEPAGPPAAAPAAPTAPRGRKGSGRANRQATIPLMPASVVPPQPSAPPPPPASGTPGQTKPTPSAAPDVDAPKAPAPRRVTAAPQASPDSAQSADDDDDTEPVVVPPPPLTRASGPSAAAAPTDGAPPPPPTTKPKS